MAFLLLPPDQAKYRHLIAQPSGLPHVPTTACICLDRLLRSAVQHACHAAFQQRGCDRQFASRASAVGQFLFLQRHEDGGDFPGHVRTGRAATGQSFDHATLLVLLRSGAIGGACRACAAVVSGCSTGPSCRHPFETRQPYPAPAMAQPEPSRLASGLIPPHTPAS